MEQDLEIPDTLSSRWLYELARDTWTAWLTPDTHNDILSGGFYATQAHDQLWVIGINNNFCYNYNLYVSNSSKISSEEKNQNHLAGIFITMMILVPSWHGW